MDTLPVLDHRALNQLRLVQPAPEAGTPAFVRSLSRYIEASNYALRTMRTALLLGNFEETTAIARQLAMFSSEIGALRVEQICNLLQDIGPGERSYFASRLLCTLEVEIRCAIAALSSHADR